MTKRLVFLATVHATLCLGLGLPQAKAESLNEINNIVVIYEENRSFDNLFGLFPGADNLEHASETTKIQIDLLNQAYPALPPILNVQGQKASADANFITTLPNAPWQVEKSLANPDYRPFIDSTGDLVHRFYQEQVQINDGLMNKFAAVSDAKGLTMSYYDISQTHLWQYAHQYVLSDMFFHGAFGGSFLNHAWLACACAFTTDATLDSSLVTVLDPTTRLPVHGHDGAVTTDGRSWVNTAQSVYLHRAGNTNNGFLVQPQTMPHIGDRLDSKSVRWKWYGDGYAAAAAATASGNYTAVDPLFQYHHHPFAYFKNLAYGSEAQKAHLQDRADLINDIDNNTLPQVAFYKPSGANNMHPGYSNIQNADQDLFDIVERLKASPLYKNMVIIITFDENGGLWDHVAVPKRDEWGPGTRIPTVIISPLGKEKSIDHTVYDTTSILKLIEARWQLEPLNQYDGNPKVMALTGFLR